MINRLNLKFLTKTLLLLLITLALLTDEAESGEVYSFSTSEAISMGLGGAVTAKLGGIENIFYNPATVSRYKDRFWTTNLSVTFHLNPSAAISYAKYAMNDKAVEGYPDVDAPLFFLRGISIHRKPFTIGAIFGEEVLANNLFSTEEWFEIREVPTNRRTATYLNIMLAKRVRIGATLTSYIVNRNYKFENLAASYGVYLEPSKYINVGVFFADHPEFRDESAEIYENNVRRDYSGIEDQSVNIGIEISPVESLSFNIDARNVFREEEKTNLELRFGTEAVILGQIAIRGGAIPRTDAGDHYYSCGIGLLNTNSFMKTPGIYETPSFAINYAFVYRDGDSKKLRTHFLTLVLDL